MIGAASMTWRLPSGPASTGQQPVFWQAATCGLAHSGGSVIERNAPPDTVMIRWAATSAAGSASVSRRPARVEPAWPSTRWLPRTVSLAACHGPGSGVARTRHGSRQRLAAPDDARAGRVLGVLAARHGEPG